jgi:Icc protein
MDQIAVQNADDLLSLLDGSPQVRLVLFGHIHQDLHHRWTNSRGGTLNFFGCPSTCVQVAPTVPTADQHLPGFRLVQLFADGQYQTRVQRVQPALVTL